MEKEYVPYEIALALKELGFDEYCISRYCLVTEWEEPTGEVLLQQSDCLVSDKNLIKAPLYQQAFRWFREKYDIGCYIESKQLTTGGNTYDYTILTNNITESDDGRRWRTYEEAELACLKKLIEIVKSQMQ